MDDTLDLDGLKLEKQCFSERMIVVSRKLPLNGSRVDDERRWVFSLNRDSLMLQLKDGFPEHTDVYFVGLLKLDVLPEEEEEVTKLVFSRFNCVPVFLSPVISKKFQEGFCRNQLWPVFHDMLSFSQDQRTGFDKSTWEAYVASNKLFCDAVMVAVNDVTDFIWIHDYHLMAMPFYLRRRVRAIRVGIFFHSPFPSSEIFKTLPVREDVLKCLLNADLIGFHTFDYARHFLSCCSRILGLEHQSTRGCIVLDYFGRSVKIKIMPVGIHVGHIHSILRLEETVRLIDDLHGHYKGKKVLLGVDDMDIFKGIDMKLLAMEQMLRTYPGLRGIAVLVQIIDPTERNESDSSAMMLKLRQISQRINDEFGSDSEQYQPIILIVKEITSVERIAYFRTADCVVVTSLRDGMNLTSYEYVISREGLPPCVQSNEEETTTKKRKKKSMLVVSEFTGCSPSLNGAYRINPWNIEETAAAMHDAISITSTHKEEVHAKHLRYISDHDIVHWCRSFYQELKRNRSDDSGKKRFWRIGLGFGFRVLSLEHNFAKLTNDDIVPAYASSCSRAILLDYDDTCASVKNIFGSADSAALSFVKTLCSDSKNTIFIVSGMGRRRLADTFSSCKNIGLAAEHGYFLRWPESEEWEICGLASEFTWMGIAKPIMRLYTEATDGSYMETKESSLVWRHQQAYPSFGSAQAKEMLDHLENVLANEPVTVNSDRFGVEVKSQGSGKGSVTEKILRSMVAAGKPADFVFCVGDDKSDEEMFQVINGAKSANLVAPAASIFCCSTEKPSKATYYLDDMSEMAYFLEAFSKISSSS